jgi:Uma2 family endonuclease
MADDQRPSAKSAVAERPAPARFSAEEFEMLIESGVAAKLGRLELRGGEIYRMNSTFAPHARMRMRFARLLEEASASLGDKVEVLDEVTTRFGAFMPLPDIVLFRMPVPRGPVPGENVLLVVEVADTTLADDLGPKRDLYAAAGVPEYWVVDMTAGVILLHADPVGGAFTRSNVISRGLPAESLKLLGLRIDTTSLPWDIA